ncbi:MAG: TetR/AcrR family transcriptional regulator [Hyphomonadaceae bacterium]|nr:TetR/AcrR family transcriptional regulator [Hyphomonadaceae bacterium]
MATQQQRSDSTRQKLLAAFRASFLERGYDATTTQQILSETGLSKGALYHHFRSKADIIEALYEHESRAAIDRAVARVERTGSPLVQLKQSYLEWMRTVRSPDVARILFEIGPSALGEQRSKQIEEEASNPPIKRLLEKAKGAGEIAPPDDDLLIRMLNALVAEAALYQLRTEKDPSKSLDLTFSAIFAAMRP